MKHLSPLRSLLATLAILPAFLLPTSAVVAQSTHSAPSAHAIEQFGEPPAIPEGALSDELMQAVETAFSDSMTDSAWGPDQAIALTTIADSGDPRLVWLIADMMRFIQQAALTAELGDAAGKLLNIEFNDGNFWGKTTDHLMAWNIPEPPDYLRLKRTIFTTIVPGCLLYTSPSPRDLSTSRMPSSA